VRTEHTGVPGEGDDSLLSALEVIENQPLAERAEAFAAIHDDLARRLEGGSSPGGAPSA
jgi:hypothetical protein